MKNFILLFILIISTFSFTQQITRGPEPGEIYFLGPTATDVLYGAIYHSTNFGETAVCVDSISALSHYISAIAADKTPGGLYFVNMIEQLFYSENYGQFSSWEYRNGGIYDKLNSGITEGYIFEGAASHSEDYGYNFISHPTNGAFGLYVESEIGFNNKGYLMTDKIDGTDTIYFFVSYDNFNNCQLVSTLNLWTNGFNYLSYGFDDSSLFYYNSIPKELYFSSDDGSTWELKNQFTCPNLPIEGITGGRQNGEIYLLVVYRQGMGYIRHVYIYHSLDYGETFTIHHPVSVGPEPAFADFIADDTLGEPPFEVQFTDLSSNPMLWEWDFNNDDIVDSYEQNPTYIYEDTGYYSIKLNIHWFSVEDYAIRYDYIHVTDLTNVDEPKPKQQNEILCYPNPFSDKITISYSSFENKHPGYISIYNISGALVKKLKLEKNNDKNEYQATWVGKDQYGTKVKQGVYYILTDNKKYSTKILFIN